MSVAEAGDHGVCRKEDIAAPTGRAEGARLPPGRALINASPCAIRFRSNHPALVKPQPDSAFRHDAGAVWWHSPHT
jgi:hypothetical protein